MGKVKPQAVVKWREFREMPRLHGLLVLMGVIEV